MPITDQSAQAAIEGREDALEAMSAAIGDIQRWLLLAGMKGPISASRRDEFKDRISRLSRDLDAI